MKRFSKKKVSKQVNDHSLQKINQQQQIFQKVSRTFTANYLRPSQHKKIMNVIHQQIKRPQTSKNLKRDYKNLMDLADCNKIIVESRQRSMMSYKKMKNINIEQTQKRIYQPVFVQIQNTEGNLSKKKYQKYDLKKFKTYLKQQQLQQNSLELFVENTLFQGMRDIKNYIPIQAKLHKKLCIFGTLLQQQKHHHVQQVKNLIMKQKQKTPNMSTNYQIYLINYYLMEKMMAKICSDSTALQLKRKNSQIYSLIKNQMIGQIINQKKFADMLKIMQQHVENQQKNKFEGDHQKFMYNYHHKSRLNQKIKVGRHNRHGSDSKNQLVSRQTTNKLKQNQLVLQFEKLYEQAQERINQAKLQLNFPTSRKNNFYSMIEMKPHNQRKSQDVF